MKVKEIFATLKFQDDAGNKLGELKAHAKYDEPENISEFLNMKSLDNDDKFRIILYGLNTYHQTKLRQDNELGKAAKILFEAKLFPSWEAAYKHLLNVQNANALAKTQVNPAA